MSYSVLYTEGDTTKDISELVSSMQFGGEIKSAARKLEVSFIYGTDYFIPKLKVKNGSLLRLFSNDKELIRTVIFSNGKNDKGDFRATGYTHGIYLTKNKDTKIFRNMKAGQIAQSLCSEFGIPVGEIDDTKIQLDKLILRDKTLWDMILIAVTETTKQSGIKYRMFFKEGKLYIKEKAKQYVMWVLEEGVNLLAADYSASIENMKNQVKVVGKLPKESKQKYNPAADSDWDAPSTQQDDEQQEFIYVAKNEKLQEMYGLMQEIKEESGDDITQSKIIQIANEMLAELAKEEIEANVEAIGLDDVEAGMAVYIVESTTGLVGSYYVEQDAHNIEGNSHTMKLKLTLTNDVPELKYEPPQEAKAAQSKQKYDPSKDKNW